MEIDKAIRGSDDRSLKTKYNNAVYLIRRALALYSIEELAFSFNGGKDSTVLLHLLRASYYLHNEERPLSNGHVTWHENTCPVRVIYFESPSSFPEINSFTHEMAKTYGLHMDIIKMDFKSGLETLLTSIPVKAIFLGVRIGDPTAVGQEQFSPSSPGWPPFMRVNPILDWSYRDVWSFLLTCKVQYCVLYDRGYTSIGNVYDTVPNVLLCVDDGSGLGKRFSPAYLLLDGRSERAGRTKKRCYAQPVAESFPLSNAAERRRLTCSVIAVGDEILSGAVGDELGRSLCGKIHSAGWVMSRMAIVPNEIDCVAQEIEAQKSLDTMVYIYGGVGPLHSDVTAAGVAKAFGVRLAPDEEFECQLRRLIAHRCTGDRSEMAQLPEGITELLHHDKLPVPLIKCENVIILMSTNVAELDVEWNCLMEMNSLMSSSKPFLSELLTTPLSDVEAAQAIRQVSHSYPDVQTGCYRTSRHNDLVIRFEGKDKGRVEEAVASLRSEFRTAVKDSD